MLVSASNKLEKEICDALGLKYVRSLEIKMKVGGIVTIIAEYYAEEDDIKKLPAILRKFELVPKMELEETSTLGEEFKTFVVKEQ